MNITKQRIINVSIIVLSVILVTLIGFEAVIKNQKKESSPATNKQTDFSLPISPESSSNNTVPLEIISVIPENKSENIALQQTITVELNRTFNRREIEFAIDPPVSYASQVKNTQLIISPNPAFSPSTRYTFSIKILEAGQFPKTYSFQTIGPTPLLLPDTQPPGGPEKVENFQKQNSPDVFLANKTPFSTADFFIMNDFISEPLEHFKFTVTLSGPDKEISKQKTIEWIKSIGLTDKQIINLDIDWKTQ